MPARAQILSKVNLFSQLNNQELLELADDFTWQEYPPGHQIIQMGQKQHHFYVLASGQAEVLVSKAGKTLALNLLHPGNTFGEVCLFTGNPASVTIRCSGWCRVLALDEEHFALMLVRWPKLYQKFIEGLSERLTQVNIGLWEAKQKEFLRSGIWLNQLKYKFYDIWGSAHTTKEIEGKITEFAQSEEHLLLIGEQGTGQQMMAWHLHKRQYGENAPFVVLDGKHLTEQWEHAIIGVDDPLGVTPHSCGLLEMAEGGTLFIKDINLISLSTQHRLVVTLKAKRIKCRLIGTLLAEHHLLSVQLIPELKSQFTREYQLKPLRERKRDIPVIAQGVLTKLARQHDRTVPQLDQEATKLLLTHHYRQGNVTELIKIMERAFFLAEGKIISLEHLFFGPPAEKIGRSIDLLTWSKLAGWIKKGIIPDKLQRLTFATLVFILMALLCWPQAPIAQVGLMLVWGIWWPCLVIFAFTLGRVWCSVCPVSFVMQLLQRIIHLNKPVPDILKKYDYVFTTVLFLLVFWVEAVSEMRFSPIATGLWLLTILIGAGMIAIIYARHTWCRHLCPLGAFTGMAAISGILEVRADSEICFNKCTTHDCFRGSSTISGCPMFQHAPFLDNNYACKLCLRCIRNCPNGAVKFNLRVPAREVWHLLRINQGIAIFVGVSFAVLLPITYFEGLHDALPQHWWQLWFTLTYWSTGLIAGAVTWWLAKPFKTKGASQRIKMVFSLIPMIVAGHIAYQLHFAPGIDNILLGLGYRTAEVTQPLSYISALSFGQGLAAVVGLNLTGLTMIMVGVRRRKKNGRKSDRKLGVFRQKSL